jgi:hypothetical protein
MPHFFNATDSNIAGALQQERDRMPICFLISGSSGRFLKRKRAEAGTCGALRA